MVVSGVNANEILRNESSSLKSFRILCNHSLNIFENLFVNIQKYAMPNSRVYIDVEKPEGNVTITMRNMSAVELNVRGDEPVSYTHLIGSETLFQS